MTAGDLIEMLDRKLYVDLVLLELERLDYASLISEFDPTHVAKSVAGAVTQMYGAASPRFTALLIYGCTMTYQVIPASKDSVKH